MEKPSPKIINIALDLRCLNYSVFTGVNIYTINFLRTLHELKVNLAKKYNLDLRITSIGISKTALNNLTYSHQFLGELLTENWSLSQYLGVSSFYKNVVLEISQIVTSIWNKSILDQKIPRFDLIFQMQPRILKINPDSKLIPIFHDLFSIVNNSQSFRQSLIYNSQICQILVDDSHKLIANSFSTAKDIENYLIKPQNNLTSSKTSQLYSKINLVYPGSGIEFLGDETDDLNPISNDLSVMDYGDQYFDNVNSSFYLYLGGIEPRKNLERVLLAHNYYIIESENNIIENKLERDIMIVDFNQQQNFKISSQDQKKPLKLVIAGRIVDPKYFEYLKELIVKEKIKNVEWKINIEPKAKNQLILESKFCIYTTLYEGFGFPIVEALDNHKLIITSQNSSCLEVGELCGNAMFVNPLKINEIAAAITLLDSDLEYFEELYQIKSKQNPFTWKELENWLESEIRRV
jgi:glycosyltransferase involved in cell wall biosynthesis